MSNAPRLAVQVHNTTVWPDGDISVYPENDGDVRPFAKNETTTAIVLRPGSRVPEHGSLVVYKRTRRLYYDKSIDTKDFYWEEAV